MAYIEKEPLCAWLENMNVSDFIIRRIKSEAHFPTADVVEVVRCEKCKYGDVSCHARTIDGKETIACYCNLKNKVTDVDDYCSSGERRDTNA